MRSAEWGRTASRPRGIFFCLFSFFLRSVRYLLLRFKMGGSTPPLSSRSVGTSHKPPRPTLMRKQHISTTSTSSIGSGRTASFGPATGESWASNDLYSAHTAKVDNRSLFPPAHVDLRQEDWKALSPGVQEGIEEYVSAFEDAEKWVDLGHILDRIKNEDLRLRVESAMYAFYANRIQAHNDLHLRSMRTGEIYRYREIGRRTALHHGTTKARWEAGRW